MKKMLVAVLVPLLGIGAGALLLGRTALNAGPARSVTLVPAAGIAGIAGITAAGSGMAAAPAAAAKAGAPTAGLHLYTDTYRVQSPYNLPTADRFSVAAGPVYSAWILQGDRPFDQTTHTGPRTEMRWSANWSGTEHMWEADVMVDSGTENSCIMQVKSNNGGREAIYIVVRNHGNLYNSVDRTPLATNMWGQWFHMAVDYNPATGVGRVWINGALVFTNHYPRSASTVWYFKNGVYNLGGARSESHFKNIQFWTA